MVLSFVYSLPLKNNNTSITPAQTDICFLAAYAPLEGDKNKLTAGGVGGVLCLIWGRYQRPL